jgi:hypothetical protein
MLILAQRKLAPTPENYALAWAKAQGLAGTAQPDARREPPAREVPARGAGCVTSSGWWPN